ncbi:hypothetical protein CEXT_142281 [Caerostris extrusa]|uniref:Uncharacterized protein n=1 Tax=Caerostris extrusa TaxID=172846 RepID=A0AAV4RZ07_CAEEX|nr:hypothetical protein CEXT_142281 [Caerostris extrusa]
MAQFSCVYVKESKVTAINFGRGGRNMFHHHDGQELVMNKQKKTSILMDSSHTSSREANWTISVPHLFLKSLAVVTDGNHPIGYGERDRGKGCITVRTTQLEEKFPTSFNLKSRVIANFFPE